MKLKATSIKSIIETINYLFSPAGVAVIYSGTQSDS